MSMQTGRFLFLALGRQGHINELDAAGQLMMDKIILVHDDDQPAQRRRQCGNCLSKNEGIEQCVRQTLACIAQILRSRHILRSDNDILRVLKSPGSVVSEQ
jgi:hypothetical protein